MIKDDNEKGYLKQEIEDRDAEIRRYNRNLEQIREILDTADHVSDILAHVPDDNIQYRKLFQKLIKEVRNIVG